jgi:hypothetical protein
VRNPSNASRARRQGECSDFVELARRMSIPTDVTIHEFIDLGTRPRPVAHDAPRAEAGLAAVKG